MCHRRKIMSFTKKNSGQILTGLLKFIILIQILGLAGLFAVKYSSYFLNSYFNRNEKIVPELVGKGLETAIEIVKARGLGIKIIEKKYSQVVSENRIISQIPASGRKVRPGREIQIILSRGSLMVNVPEIVGKPYRTAGIILRNEGFSIGKTSYINDNSREIDTVIAQYPPEGNMIPKSTPVDLLISLGRGQRLVKVPNFMGLDIDTAIGKLTRAGLKPGKLSFTIEERETLNIVLAQLPKKDLQVEKGSTVDLLINGQRPAGFSQDEFSKSFYEASDSGIPSTNITSPPDSDTITRTSVIQNSDVIESSGNGLLDGAFETEETDNPDAITDNPDINTLTDEVASKDPYMPGFNESEDSFGYFSSSMKKDVLLDFVVPENSEKTGSSKIKMILIDFKGISKIYDTIHKTGEKLSIQVTGYGKVKILIYVNNTLSFEKNY